MTRYKIENAGLRPLYVTVEQVRAEVEGAAADLQNTAKCRYERAEAERRIALAKECIDAIDRHTGDLAWEHATAPWLGDALYHVMKADYARTGGHDLYRFQRS